MQGDINDALTTLQVTREIRRILGDKDTQQTAQRHPLVKVALGTLELQSDAQR